MKPPLGSSSKTPSHGIADHAFGADAGHVHAPGEEHDHDHDGMDLLADGVSDDVVLTSIGIDIGSSGTQVAFARLMLEAANAEDGDDAAPRRRSTRRREAMFQSPVYLTPLVSGDRIDADRIEAIVAEAFAAAKLTPDDIDCGVVILTGAARERVNAAAITARLADTCGDIVSATAGHHMEARIAAHGSGAAQRSQEFGERYLNVDIGGATTKLAICEDGRVVATAALMIGGRLVVTDKADRITRLEPAGVAHAADAGFTWHLGGIAPWVERKAVGEAMAAKLVAALTGKLAPDDLAQLSLTGPLPLLDAIVGVIVSGGVGEYVYGRETRSFSDLGLPLGRSLAAKVDAGRLPWPLMPAGECIRATVLGASAYTVQLSGRTGAISAPATLLPRRNLPVICPAVPQVPNADAVATAIKAHLAASDLAETGMEAAGDIVLALSWQGPPEHAHLAALANGICEGMASRLDAGRPLYLILEADIAASIGAILKQEQGLANDILVLDGIALDDLDYVDLGRIRLPSGTVPVTIKSLVFRDEQAQKSPRKRLSRPLGGTGFLA